MKGGILMKDKKVLAVKVLGFALTIGGMIAANWSGKQEQDEALKKFVKEELQDIKTEES